MKLFLNPEASHVILINCQFIQERLAWVAVLKMAVMDPFWKHTLLLVLFVAQILSLSKDLVITLANLYGSLHSSNVFLVQLLIFYCDFL